MIPLASIKESAPETPKAVPTPVVTDQDNGETITASDGLIITLLDLADARAELDRQKARVAKLEERVKAHMGPAATLATPDGIAVATWKTTVSKRLDQKALGKDHPDLVDRYRVESVSRRFTLKAKALAAL